MNRTYGPRTATPPAPRTNKYGGKCTRCNQWVHESAGTALKDGNRWVVQHNAGLCPEPGSSSKPANAEPGYYVRADGTAIKVVTNKKGTYTYGKALRFPADGSRPSWNYERGLGISVAELKPMSAADAGAMGLAHGFCVQCCAPLGPEDPAKATLSALVSALIGYGEKCASNEGWPYPKGVKAQRAYMAEHGS